MEILKIFTAASVLIFPLLFLVILQFSAKNGMLLSYIIFIILAFLIWGLNLTTILAGSFGGVIKALSIIWILFGAILLLNILRRSGAMDIIISGFENLTDDKRLHILLIGFYFVALLEGASGFGAPAAIAAPLLVVMGIPPIAAASLSLIGNAVPMTFGAVGTPLIDGMGAALVLKENSGITIQEIIKKVSINASFIDLFVGSLVPTLLVILYTTIFSEKKSWRYTFEIIPFSLISGFIYTLFAHLSTLILGPEFGALLGSLLGLMVLVLLIKKGFLLPKVENIKKVYIPKKILFKAWLPYLIVVFLLITTRIILPLKTFLKSLTFHFPNILRSTIDAKFDMFYSPGFVLTITSLIVIMIYKLSKEEVSLAVKETLISAKKTAFALIPALAMVYVFLNSQNSHYDYLGMPNFLAFQLADLFSDKWLFIAPYLGNLGTFVSGSTTTSNIMFSQIQYDVSLHNRLGPVTILTAQALGANTGCMISISKVVSVCAVVNLTGFESKVMRITIFVSLIYAFIVGLMIYLLL